MIYFYFTEICTCNTINTKIDDETAFLSYNPNEISIESTLRTPCRRLQTDLPPRPSGERVEFKPILPICYSNRIFQSFFKRTELEVMRVIVLYC